MAKRHYLAYLTAMLTAWGIMACSDAPDLADSLVQGQEEEMAVRIGFDLPGEDVPAATRSSVVGGTEDEQDYVKSLHMVCFTRDGIYLGSREATLEGTETTFTHDGVTCQGRDLFIGTVPARTARIHFVANVTENSILGNDQIGGNENTLVKSARMSVSAADNQRICYWGFHGEPSSEAMRDWLAVLGADGTYHKNGNNSVHLVRDRAKVQFGHMYDYFRGSATTVTVDGESTTLDANDATYKILSIDWIITNGLNKGYLAPYCETNSSDHFDNYYSITANKLVLKDDRLTPYDKSDASRFTVEESQMVNIFDASKNADPLQCSVDNPMFLFEDNNDPANPPKLILRVKYQKHRNQTGVNDQVTKYFTLMLLNASNEPCKIFRNHSYQLDIYGMPWEGLGYMTFEEALNSAEYINNRTVTINDKVHVINDGRFQLYVNETTKLFQDPSLVNTTQSVTFTYKAIKSSESTDDIDASNFTAKWKDDAHDGASFAGRDVTVEQISNDGTTFTGRVKFTLGTVINQSLQSGTIELHDINSNLTRFINVYTITQFSFIPSGASAVVLESTGESRQVNSVTCPTYKMTLNIPGNFPVGLFPISIYMASTTLNPFKRVSDHGDEDTSMSVLLAGTENGDIVDGEALAGMNYVTDNSKWNYRATGSPWNYWYTNTLLIKQTINNDGASEEDTRDHTYTFYFDDVRQLRDAVNRPDDVGLFLKIQYFGDAVAVTP